MERVHYELLLQPRLLTVPELQATAGSSAQTKHPSVHFDLQKDFASSTELCATAVVPTLYHGCCIAKNSFWRKINTENVFIFSICCHRICCQAFFMHASDLP